jgi:ketosteroid isomerase-like protein
MSAPVDFDSLFQSYRMAVLNKEVDALTSLYGRDVVAFDMWDAWRHDGHAWREMNEQWLTSLGSESVVVEFDDIEIVSGAEVAAAHATVTYKAVSEAGETLRSMQNRLTWVAKQENGAWEIIHQHTSAPIDPSTMTAILHRKR